MFIIVVSVPFGIPLCDKNYVHVEVHASCHTTRYFSQTIYKNPF
jgi:hypothetical protein